MRDFVINEDHFTLLDGKKMFFRSVTGTAEKTVVILHGACEHSGRYLSLIKFLWERGYSVFAPDLRGHGKSEGQRVHIDSFSDYLADFDLIMQENIKSNQKFSSSNCYNASRWVSLSGTKIRFPFI